MPASSVLHERAFSEGYKLFKVSVWSWPLLWVGVRVVYSQSVMWIHSSGLAGQREVPGQEFVDPADGVVGDAFKDVLEIDLWVEPVELGRAEQRVDGGGAFTTGV